MSKANAIMTKSFAKAVEAGATWVTIKNEAVTGAFDSRNAARAAKLGTAVAVKNATLMLATPSSGAKGEGKPDLPMGERKSSIESPCFVVWDTAEKMLKKDPDARRKDIIAACVGKGVAFYTARTQFQLFKQSLAND